MAEEHTEVRLLMNYIDGKPVYEAVPAVRVGQHRFRIAASPGFAPGVAAGDEIELAPSEKLGYRVLKRSGNVCVQLFLHACSDRDRERITEKVESIGGWLDGGQDAVGSGHLLIFTIPVTAGFDEIKRVMDEVSAAFDVDRWMYGNVYDTSDGETPLDWWL